MQNEKNDMKIRLSASLKEKMLHKALEKITIRELTEDCGVNRQTFYYHFEDIYDLLKWMYQKEIEMLTKKQESVKTWQEALIILLKYLDENKTLCLCTINSLGHRNLRRFFYADINNIVRMFLSNKNSEENDFEDFLMHFYTVSLGTLMESWLLEETDKTPQQLISYLERIIPFAGD